MHLWLIQLSPVLQIKSSNHFVMTNGRGGAVLPAVLVGVVFFTLPLFSWESELLDVPPYSKAINELQSSCRSWSVSDQFPTVNWTVPANSTEIWFQNETFLTTQNMGLSLELTCEAPFPITWIESYDQASDGLNGVHVDKLNKILWNEVVDEGEGAQGEWLYRSKLQIQYPGSLCAVSNFSCQSTSDHCSQTNVLLALNQTTDLIDIRITQQPQSPFVIVDELKVRQSSPEYNEEPCDLVMSYWLHPTKAQYGWKCEVASSGSVITDRLNEFIACDSAAHCNTFYRHQQRGTKCLKKLQKCHVFCAFTNDFSYKPGFIICRYNGLSLAQHYFYAVPQLPNETPDIYFDWNDVDPQNMLLLEPVTNETYVGDSVTVYCQVSRYYFAYGHHFALEYENGSVQHQPADDGEYFKLYNANRMNMTIELSDTSPVKNVYCLAPVWNSTLWVNQSAEINILSDSEPPKITSLYQETETIFWYTGQVKRSISCSTFGKPTPTISWTAVDTFDSKYSENSLGEFSSEIQFDLVAEDIEGKYVCEAENFLGVARKVYRVVVIDQFKLVVQTICIVVISLLLFSLLVMVLCWKKIKQQRKQIRLLTEAEIKEFLEGNLEAVHSNDYLDTSDLIQSLPYNPKFEIPKEMIHIDASKVLGSGNFGQVLKGSIQLLESQNGSCRKTALTGMNSIDVAVKTVKQNMEMLYFKTLLSEVKIMAHIGKHPNIVSLVGACTQNIRKREIFIAVEFCINGSLESFLRKNRKGFINLVKNDAIMSLPEQRHAYENVDEKGEDGEGDVVISTNNLIKWSREIANGMEFLGSKKIIHGDLATRNIFLSDELVAKIGDFGLSRQLLEYSNYVKSEEVPLPWKWMAIEFIQEMKFSVYTDIWAYGITIWEVFTLANVPYPGVSWSADFLDQLCNGMRMHKPSFATTTIYNTMLDCWSHEPNQRPSFRNLKTFFEKQLEDSSEASQNYFQPHCENVTKSKENGSGGQFQNYLQPRQRNDMDTSDSGIAEDTQGYLLPLLESQLV